MKILVPLKRTADPDNANKIKIAPGGAKVVTDGLEPKPNPFDEYAVETALRLTENGTNPKARLAGDSVVVCTFGAKEASQTLRQARNSRIQQRFGETQIGVPPDSSIPKAVPVRTARGGPHAAA